MLFSSAYPLAGLIAWCRSLRHGIGAGLQLPHLFGQLSRKGPLPMRPAASRLANRLEKGEALEDVLGDEKGRFPDLFIDLVSVGERTGHLPEIFRELEEFYSRQLQLKRQFRSEIIWPAFQFFAAVIVIGLLLVILGFIGDMTNSEPLDPLGIGTGIQGAAIWFGSVTVILVGGYFLYRYLSRNVRHWASVEAFLLRVPAFGPCLDALAMQKFCLCLGLTMEAGLKVAQALKRSLRSTGNRAFMRCEDRVSRELKTGREVTEVLSGCGVFTEEFLHTLAVAEETGQIPEVMARQAENYREEASRRLTTLTKMAGFAVWAIVAIFLIILIFRVAGIYFDALNSV